MVSVHKWGTEGWESSPPSQTHSIRHKAQTFWKGRRALQNLAAPSWGGFGADLLRFPRQLDGCSWGVVSRKICVKQDLLVVWSLSLVSLWGLCCVAVLDVWMCLLYIAQIEPICLWMGMLWDSPCFVLHTYALHHTTSIELCLDTAEGQSETEVAAEQINCMPPQCLCRQILMFADRPANEGRSEVQSMVNDHLTNADCVFLTFTFVCFVFFVFLPFHRGPVPFHLHLISYK